MAESAPNPQSFQVEILHEAGLSDDDIADGTGAELDPVRLTSLVAIVRGLSEVLAAESIRPWMFTRVPSLHGERPMDLVSRGEGTSVERVINGLKGTIAS